jgi:Domain of Unknown Function with PDB structure (DUF3857)
MTRAQRIMCSLSLLLLWSIISPRSSHAIDWLPVAPEDLALKDNPKQPGADAMILYRESVIDARKANTSGDTIEEYFRIKIFTQEGTKQGHVEIPFDKKWEDVNYVSGRTIRADGSIVKFDGQVLEATVERRSGLKFIVKTFTLPDVQPGCIIEYKFSRQALPGYVHNEEWTISHDIYTREAHFTYFPFGGYDINSRYRTYLVPSGSLPKQQTNGAYVMSVNDIPGIEDETLMPPEKTMRPRVEFYYEEPDSPSEDDPTPKYWDHWAKKWNGDLEHFIDKKNALEQELSKTAATSDSPEDKLRKIYIRVQQLRNLSFEEYRTEKEMKDENLKLPSNVEELLSRGYGSERQINYLFAGLTRTAGFDSTVVYIAPRNSEIFTPDRKDRRELNADIVWVRAGSKEYYLDPAARYFPFGILPWYETGAGGVRADKHGATIITTPVPVSSDSTITRKANLEVKEDGSVSGTLRAEFSGQQAALLREEKRKGDETGRRKDLQEEIEGWLPAGSSYEVTSLSNWEDTTRPIDVEGTLNIPSFGRGVQQRMLMPIELFQVPQVALFSSQKRVNPVYFHYPYEEIDDINVRLPAGCKAESVPPEHKVNLGAVSYEISAIPAANGVEVKRHLVVGGVLFSKDAYPTLRAFFGTVRTNDNAQMVLQNATSAKNN